VAPILVEPLTPAGPPRTIPELLAEVAPRSRARDTRPCVYVDMVASVDGRAGLDGTSAALGDDADLEMLLELRTLADAVLVGTGTLRAEGYDRLVRDPGRRARRVDAGAEPDPVAVLIARRLEVPWDAGLFAAPDQPVLVYTTAPGADAPPPGVAAPVQIVSLPDPSPAAVLADLRARGVRSLLCEGGPSLNRALLAAGLVDELFLTVAPLVTADDGEPPIVTGGALHPPGALALRWVLRHGDELFLRYGVTGR
jgi:riboflavin biosynthesis pyrimidine reductase